MPTKSGRMTAAELRAKVARQSKQLSTVRKRAREAAQDVAGPAITGYVMQLAVNIVGAFLPRIPGISGNNRQAIIYGVASMLAPTLTKDKARGRTWRDAALALAGSNLKVMELAGSLMGAFSPTKDKASEGGARDRLGQAIPVAQLRGPQPYQFNNNARTRARSRFAA